MKLSIGFSPCPNDTFIFDALVNHKIDTGGIEFEPVLEDVQTLNEWALKGRLAVTKLSYGVLPLVLNSYKLLNSGSALGIGVGPLLISEKETTITNINDQLIAIPGENTTAHLLFSYKYPGATNKIFMRYDAIEDFVLKGKGLGVIIHENRFTYEEKGLHKITDLGDYWEQQTQLPIPLGGIVVNSNVEPELQIKINHLIKQSIQYAYTQYPELNEYIQSSAQEMSEAVMRKHIDLYVNDFSVELGEKGKNAVNKLLEIYTAMHPGTIIPDDIFVL